MAESSAGAPPHCHPFTTEGGGHTVVVRQCPLCARISPHDHGFMGLHDGQHFCDRCMDDLAALIKARRLATTAERMKLADDLWWPIGYLHVGEHIPAHGEWKRREDLESEPIAGGNQIWERIA